MRIASYLLAGSLAATASTSAYGQNSNQPGTAQFRNDCRLAAQVLQSGQPANKFAWAADMIGACPQEGPAVLAQLWGRPSVDSATADRLLNASVRIRDQRIASAALEIARNPSREETVRIIAIGLLFLYADPSSSISFGDMVPPPGWVPGQHVRMLSPGQGSHEIPQQVGDFPLPGGFAAETAVALRALGASDPNPRIQYVATGLARRLEHRAGNRAEQ
jgi:hypothetical protein